jgi:hypothetical protein
MQREQGASDDQMGRYRIRVLPPRDHRRGWAQPYARPSGYNGKGGASSSSSNSGKGAAYLSSYPSREQEAENRRVQQLQVSKWDRKIQEIDENNFQFLESVFRLRVRGESQEWLRQVVRWGLRHQGDLSPFPLGQDLTEKNYEPTA